MKIARTDVNDRKIARVEEALRRNPRDTYAQHTLSRLQAKKTVEREPDFVVSHRGWMTSFL